MKKTLFAIITSLALTLCLQAQSQEYTLFRTAIVELHTEAQKGKADAVAAHQLSLKEVEPYQNRKPEISILGMEPEKAEQLEKKMQEALSKNPGEAKKVEPKQKIKKDRRIKFEQVHMVEGKGTAMAPAYLKEPKETKWVSTETIVTEETIPISAFSPDKQKEFSALGKHNENTIKLNRIGFIEAIHKETESPAAYPKFIKDMKEAGFDLEASIRQGMGLQKNEQLPFVKAQLMEIINKVVDR